MAGATISLDDAYGAPAPTTAPAPLAGAASATAQTPQTQGDFDFAGAGYRPVHDPASGNLVAWLPPASAPPATALNPQAPPATPGDTAPATFTAPLPTPPSESAPAPNVISLDDAYQGAPAGADGRPVNEALGFAEGVTKPSDNAATWLSKLPGMHIMNLLASSVTGRPTMDQAAAQRAKDFATAEQTQRPGMLGKLGGEVVGTLPTMALPGGPLAQGALAGAMLTDHPNDPAAVARDAAGGAAGAWLGGRVLGGLGRLALPTVRPEVQTLVNAGVPLTPGQIAGGLGKRVEDAMTSWPVLGDAIRAAQRRGMEGFNRAALSRALEPIGENVPNHVNIGRDGVGYVQDRLGAAYDALAPQLRADLDVPFVTGVGNVRTAIAPEALDAMPTFDRVFRDEVLQRADPTTMALDGNAARQAQEAIGAEIRGMSPNADPKTRAVVRGLRGLQDQLQASIERNSPPGTADRLHAINEGYANFVRTQGASANAGEKADGLFTPSQLGRAVKTADRTTRKGAYARGDALMQDLAAAGDRVLPSSVPDSGTPLRLLISELPMLVGFGAESAHFAPKLGGALALGGMAGLPYTRFGQPIATRLMTQRPWTPAQANAVFNMLRPGATDLGAVGSENATQRIPQLPQRRAIPAPR